MSASHELQVKAQGSEMLPRAAMLADIPSKITTTPTPNVLPAERGTLKSLGGSARRREPPSREHRGERLRQGALRHGATSHNQGDGPWQLLASLSTRTKPTIIPQDGAAISIRPITRTSARCIWSSPWWRGPSVECCPLACGWNSSSLVCKYFLIPTPTMSSPLRTTAGGCERRADEYGS